MRGAHIWTAGSNCVGLALSAKLMLEGHQPKENPVSCTSTWGGGLCGVALVPLFMSPSACHERMETGVKRWLLNIAGKRK